jgi:hypothetical protein
LTEKIRKKRDRIFQTKNKKRGLKGGRITINCERVRGKCGRESETIRVNISREKKEGGRVREGLILERKKLFTNICGEDKER